MKILKILNLLMVLLLLTSCRTRKKTLEIKEFHTVSVENFQKDSAMEDRTEALAQVRSQVVLAKKEKENSGEVEIRGITDSIHRNFDYHTIVGGDTLSEIHISGNAEFVVKNRFRQTTVSEKSIMASDSLNMVAKIARAAVAQSTIKDVAGKIREVSKEVKSTGFQWPVWVVIGLCAIVLVALWYLGRNTGNFLTQIFNKNK